MSEQESRGNASPAPPAPAEGGRRPPAALHALAERGPLVLYLVVAIVALVVVNVIASRHSKSWDLTQSRRYSLSGQSNQILRGLKQPLQMLYFDRSSGFGQAKQLLSQYQRETNKVSVEYIDPDRHPDQARQYQIQNYGTTVVASGGRHENVTSLTESDVTNAIVRVLKGAKKDVYFVEGDGEFDPGDSGRTGYSGIKTALESDNFTVNTLVLAETPQVPADCNVLIVAGPTHPLLQPEVTAIANYVNGGGDAVFLVNYQVTGPLIDYLQNTLDVKLTPDIVVDTSGIGRLFGASELMPIAATYESHPITATMHGAATLYPDARTVEPADNAGSRATVQTLVETTPASLAATKFTDNEVNTDGARPGPLPLAVAGTLPVTVTGGADAGDSGEARYVVIGSPDVVANNVLGFQGNQDFFLNAMNWTSGQEAFITVPPKPEANSPVNLSEAQMKLLLWLLLIGLPAVIAIAGFGVWMRRRAL